MQYTFSDLRVCLAMAKTGNLTIGAEKVCLTPSTASRKLKTLDSNIGKLLLSRCATASLAGIANRFDEA